MFVLSVTKTIVLLVWFCSSDNVRSDCEIRTNNEFSQANFIQHVSSANTRLIRGTLGFQDNNVPNSANWGNYRLTEWQVATQSSGVHILTSHPDTEFFSLGFFSLGTVYFDLPITSQPAGCLQNVTEADFTQTILNFLFSDLSPSGPTYTGSNNASVLPTGTKVCYEKATLSDTSVSFQLICCLAPNNCEPTYAEFWQNFYFYSIAILNFFVFLYVTNLIPESFYRDRQGFRKFLYKFDESVTFEFHDDNSQNRESFVELGLKTSKKLISSGKSLKTLLSDTNRQVRRCKVKAIWFRVPNFRLVSNDRLPINFLNFLNRRLFQCNCYAFRSLTKQPYGIRPITSVDDVTSLHEDENDEFNLKACCDLPICDLGQSRLTCPNWSTILQVFMRILSLAIFAVPWILIYTLDAISVEGKRSAYAQSMQVTYTPPLYAFNLLRFVKNHTPGFSIAWMVLYGFCAAVISVYFKIDTSYKDYVGKQVRRTLRHAKQRWDKGLLKASRFNSMLFLPFKYLRNYGLLALLLWPLWLFTACPFAVIIVLLLNTPTVNIFLRLLIIFLKDIIQMCRSKLDNSSVKRFILAICLLIILFIVHFFIFSLVSLLVNVIAYTLAGVIVTANETFRYFSFAMFIILNAYDSFHQVEKRYIVFHDKLQEALLCRLRDKIKKIAQGSKEKQPNTAFTVPIEFETHEDCYNTNSASNIATSPTKRLLWLGKSIVQFLDNDDKLHLSEKFFFKACYMDYYGCPGDFASSLLAAVIRISVIFVFLAFVILTLTAYGGLAENSASGLLVTLSWGLLPLLINRFFSRPLPELSLDTDDFNFQNKLDSLIHDFCEYWEVIDFEVEDLADDSSNHDRRATGAFNLKVSANRFVQVSVIEDGIEDEKMDEKETTL